MTTRLAKVSRTSKPPLVQLACPGCRAIRKCRPIGVATVDGRRREVVQCSEPSCELQWLPSRQHLPTAPMPPARTGPSENVPDHPTAA